MNEKYRFLTRKASAAALVLRLTLGIVFFAHGAQKMFGWFGGHGYEWTLKAWKQWFGFPELLTHLVIWGEFLASLLVLLGLFTRYAAGVIIGIMIGAIYFVHAPWGFFMNWYMEPKVGEGFEYHVLAIGLASSLIFLGDGNYSLAHLYLDKGRTKSSGNDRI